MIDMFIDCFSLESEKIVIVKDVIGVHLVGATAYKMDISIISGYTLSVYNDIVEFTFPEQMRRFKVTKHNEELYICV